ncbi:glycerophosphodiester phosphodiesterase [Fodinicurvata sediminis]|uniref:glycerophosphodiester phosphodiesterase n=1 Tax=Fodinicurvata sediminis TaxID=1121832 RepID=UPI0003B484C7|nr:glycerophosphodiester phosphodiesterase [Fodinicurvata sediminis]
MVDNYPYLDAPRPLAFAHRGGSLEGEENTLAAFGHAVALGYRYIETDVQVSSDGVAVVFHDDTLERTTNGRGAVSSHSWRALQKLQTRQGEPLCRVEEALEAFPDCRFNIDPKCDAVVAPLAKAIVDSGAEQRVCIASFEERRVHDLRKHIGSGVCWAPGKKGVARLWLAAHGIGVPTAFPTVQVPPRYKGIPLITHRFVRTARKRGVQIHVWTVNERDEMEALLDLGVDGIMTDRPSLLKQLLISRNQWNGE